MKSLTICMTTSRRDEKWQEWTLPSLNRQNAARYPIELMLIDLNWKSKLDKFSDPMKLAGNFLLIPPKPNVWQGEHRLAKENWWAVCNARNTAICMCKTDWLCFLDDRCVLTPNWLQCVREAMDGGYILAGSYEKRQNMKVENGVIVDAGILQAEDARVKSAQGRPMACPGEWLFGCNLAMPLEWLLKINGYPELWCDSMSFEDCILGLVLANNGFPMKFDPRAKMIEDRTPSELGETMKRTAWEKHPNDTNDKAHTVLKKVRSGIKTCENLFSIRELRDKIQSGQPFPIPTEPQKEWFTGKLLSELE